MDFTITDKIITEKLQTVFGVPVFVGYAPEDKIKRLETFNYFIIRANSINGQNASKYTQALRIVRVYENAADLQEIQIINALKDINLSELNPVATYDILRKGDTDNFCDIVTFNFARGVKNGKC